MHLPFARAPLALGIALSLPLTTLLAAPADQADLSSMTITTTEPNAPTAEGYRAPPASTTTRLGLTPRETPQTVTSVTRQQIDDFKLNDIQDVVASTPGVTVEQIETERTVFTSRGFDVTNFQYDGVGIPFTEGILYGGLDTALYEQVDILKGANGLMTGTGDPSATVNLVRKRPTAEPQAQVSVTAGSWNKRRLDVDASGALTPSANVRGRVIYAHEKADSYLDRYSREKNIFGAIVEADVDENTLVTLGYERQDTQPNGSSWGALPHVDANGNLIHYSSRDGSTAQKWSYWNVDRQRAFAELAHDFGHGWKGKLTVTGVKEDEDALQYYAYTTSGFGTDLAGMRSRYYRNNEQLLGDANVSGPFQLLGREHQLTLGVTASRSRTNEKSGYQANGLYQGDDLATALDGGYAKPIITDYPADQASNFTDRQKSVYAAARFNVTDDLKVITGARMLNADSSGESYGASRRMREHGVVTPYAGVVYDLTPEYSLYASYAETFNPQYRLNIDGGLLDPMRSKNYEVGLKGELLDKKLNVSAALFRTYQDNYYEYAGYSTFYYYNQVDLKSSGVELQASGEVAPGLEVNGGYTYVYIVDANDDRTREFVPRHSLKLSTTYKVPQVAGLKVGARVNWQSETQDATYAQLKQESYALVDLMSSYDFDRNWSLGLNLNNLTDRKYLQTFYYGNGQTNYGAPRNVSATLTWKY